MKETNIEIAKRCYPKGTKYLGAYSGVEQYVDGDFHYVDNEKDNTLC